MISKAARIFFYAGILAFTSCKLEPCKDYRCINGQALEDGKDCICLCDLGWDGADCTVEDKCVTNQVVCYNGGYCNSSGLCTCVSGYEGDSCEILSRTKFLGAGDTSVWNATDTCASLIYQYEIKLEEGSDNRTLEIYNIRSLGAAQFITVSANKLTIDQKNDVLIGSVEIRDLFGTLSTDRSNIRVTYESDDGLTSDCRGKWARQ